MPLGTLGGLGIDIWQIPLDDGNFDFALPQEAELSCHTKSLTRVASLSRFVVASPLRATNREMQDEVAKLLEIANSADLHSEKYRRAVAFLLSIATGTPVEMVSGIRWIDELDREHASFGYPGVLTDDARWLIRSEYNPREQATGTFVPKTIHIPIPPSLVPYLLEQKSDNSFCKRVITDIPGQSTRRQSIWMTTLFGSLMRNRMFGTSMAQHVIRTSHGLDDAPVFYDSIPADTIAHEVASVTHPWFKDKSRPPAMGMPRHLVGSIRGKGDKEVRKLMQSLLHKFNNEASLCEQVTHMASYVLHGFVIATAMRINENIEEITLRRMNLRHGLATLSDKPIPGQHHRLVAIPRQVITGLLTYLRLLEVAKEKLPGTTLAMRVEMALKGEGPLFLVADGENNVRPLTDSDYLASLPHEWHLTPNWARHTTNQALARHVPVHLRVTQMGWSGTSGSAISNLSNASAIGALDAVRDAAGEVVREMGWRPPKSSFGVAEIPTIPVRWAVAKRSHNSLHIKRAIQLKNKFDGRMRELAESSESRVNAFLEMNSIPLRIRNGCLDKVGEETDPVQITRDLHVAIRKVIAGGDRQSQNGIAMALVYRWMSEARQSAVIEGPLPNRAVAVIPRHSGYFYAESSHAKDHAEQLWGQALGTDISFDTRIFLTALLKGGIASFPLVMACMDPRVRVDDLVKNGKDLLLVQPQMESASVRSRITGTIAFDGLAALALRAWHRSGKKYVKFDEARIREELGRVYENAFGMPIGVGEVFEEIEAMACAANALTAPGIIRCVAMGEAHPSFAGIERVMALHDNKPISPRPGHEINQRLIRATHLGLEVENPVPATYRALTRILRTASPDDLEAGFKGLKRKVRSLGEDKPVETFGEVMILFAMALLDGGGLKRESLELSTIRGHVYSIGRALTKAMPGKVALESPLTWETAYLRMIHTTADDKRPWLVDSIRYFHRILCREFSDIPGIQFGPLFSHIVQHAGNTNSGFLTGNEIQAIVTCSGLLKAQAEAKGNRRDIEEQTAGHLLVCVAASTTLRPREYQVPRVAGVRASTSRIRIGLRSRRDAPLKSMRARRVVKLRGPWAREATREVVANLRRRRKLNFHGPNLPLFQALDQQGVSIETSDLTNRLNGLVRAVTGRLEDDSYLFRKTAAIRLFRNVMAASSCSAWPMIEVLAEMGHAEPDTLVNFYVHDPVTLMVPMGTTPKIPTMDASWILGMGRVTTRRLLNQQHNSWLYRGTSEGVVLGMAFHLPMPAHFGTFSADPLEAEMAARLICRGESIENVVRLVGWPDTSVEPLRMAIQDLEDSGIALSPTDAKALLRINPPRINRQSGHFRSVLRDRSSWTAMAGAFEEWKRYVPIRELAGVPMQQDRWRQLLATAPHVAAQGWVAKTQGRTIIWTPETCVGKQSAWPKWRWMMLAIWLSGRVTQLSTSQE